MLVSIVLFVGANVYNETFDEANRAYASGDYAAAIGMYEQLVAEPVVAPVLFFNLGNAYYRAGRIGPAIANYERAIQLDPSLIGAHDNLAKALRETERRLARPRPPDWEQSLLFWHYKLSRRMTHFLAGLFWCALWCTLAVRQWRPLRYTKRAAVVLGILAVAFGASAWSKAHPVRLAVANDPHVPVYYGTDENETVHFELFAGDRVTVDMRTNGWARIGTVDGKRGWAQDKQLTFVGPPYEAPAISEPVPEPREGQPS